MFSKIVLSIFIPHITNTWHFQIFDFLLVCLDMTLYFTVALIHIALISIDTEKFFLCLLSIHLLWKTIHYIFFSFLWVVWHFHFNSWGFKIYSGQQQSFITLFLFGLCFCLLKKLFITRKCYVHFPIYSVRSLKSCFSRVSLWSVLNWLLICSPWFFPPTYIISCPCIG